MEGEVAVRLHTCGSVGCIPRPHLDAPAPLSFFPPNSPHFKPPPPPPSQEKAAHTHLLHCPAHVVHCLLALERVERRVSNSRVPVSRQRQRQGQQQHEHEHELQHEQQQDYSGKIAAISIGIRGRKAL